MTPTPEELDGLEARLRGYKLYDPKYGRTTESPLCQAAADTIKALRAEVATIDGINGDLRTQLGLGAQENDALRLSLEAARGEIEDMRRGVQDNRDWCQQAIEDMKRAEAERDAAHAKLAGAEKLLLLADTWLVHGPGCAWPHNEDWENKGRECSCGLSQYLVEAYATDSALAALVEGGNDAAIAAQGGGEK